MHENLPFTIKLLTGLSLEHNAGGIINENLEKNDK